MPNQFKNTFGVKGTPKQIEAAKEHLEQLGYFDGDQGVEAKGEYLLIVKGAYCHISSIDPYYQYSLPAQWDEFMKAASEKLECTFERGQLVVNDEGTVIMCTGNDTKYEFEGILIATTALSEIHIGTHKDNWGKQYFTLHTEPVTIKNK